MPCIGSGGSLFFVAGAHKSRIIGIALLTVFAVPQVILEDCDIMCRNMVVANHAVSVYSPCDLHNGLGTGRLNDSPIKIMVPANFFHWRSHNNKENIL